MNELKLANPYNLERIADIYDIDFVHTFSAIADAECLADIYFAYKRGLYDSGKLESYKKFYEYREIIGRYKLTVNNIKNAEEKLERLKKMLAESESDSEKYKELNQKALETMHHISAQRIIADILKPKAEEGKKFLDENKNII